MAYNNRRSEGGGRKVKIKGTNAYGRTFRSAPKESAKPKARTVKKPGATAKSSRPPKKGFSLSRISGILGAPKKGAGVGTNKGGRGSYKPKASSTAKVTTSKLPPSGGKAKSAPSGGYRGSVKPSKKSAPSKSRFPGLERLKQGFKSISDKFGGLSNKSRIANNKKKATQAAKKKATSKQNR